MLSRTHPQKKTQTQTRKPFVPNGNIIISRNHFRISLNFEQFGYICFNPIGSANEVNAKLFNYFDHVNHIRTGAICGARPLMLIPVPIAIRYVLCYAYVMT